MAGITPPKREFSGMKFGEASMVDLPQLHLDWYRFAMEGGAKPSFLQQQVAYYVTGAERWRYADTLEAITAESKPYFLDSNGDSAQTEYSSGRLVPGHAGSGAPDRYRYDPTDLSLAALESESNLDSALDQGVFRANTAHVVYVSAPFAQASELSGFFRLEAWLSIDQPDTDFLVTVSEISSDGTVIPLTSDVMRARYRESPRTQKLVTSKAPLRYDFNRFTFASRVLQKGSRLRVGHFCRQFPIQRKELQLGKSGRGRDPSRCPPGGGGRPP
jgi:putative CocE/NonD family hydrolase